LLGKWSKLLLVKYQDIPNLRPSFTKNRRRKNAMSMADSGSGKDTSARRTKRNGFNVLKILSILMITLFKISRTVYCLKASKVKKLTKSSKQSTRTTRIESPMPRS
jgi:hypothetical protein